MRYGWRIRAVLGLAVLFGGTAANAQGGGAVAGAQVGGSSKGSVSSDSGQEDETADDPKATTPAPPPRSRVPTFNRVTSTRRETVPASPQAARSGAKSPGTGRAAQSDPGRPYTSQALQARARAAKAQVPAGSTGQPGPRRRAIPPPPAIESTTRNYYPGMKPGQQLNANTAQVKRGGQRLTGAAATVVPGMSGGTSAGRVVARPGPNATQKPARSGSGSLARR